MYLGCTSVVVPDGEHLDFEVVRETMAHSAVTVAHFVPGVGAQRQERSTAVAAPSERTVNVQ